MSGPSIEVSATDDFEPSDRLRGALERVARAYEEQTGAPITGVEEEVSGYAAKLTIGSVSVKPLAPSGTSWRDGCWGFDGRSGSCGWYQGEDGSCVYYYMT